MKEGPCPLCDSGDVEPFAEAHGRSFLECRTCRLVHVIAEQRPGPEQERAHYDHHENDPADPRYRAFLSRVADPLIDRLAPGAAGLDYGSGPGPTLSVMLEERGFPTALYDPFFAPGLDALRHSYDFITCTETAEHFFSPRKELEKLDKLLRPGGWLAIMTEVLGTDRPFDDWRYVRDPTHVCFYRHETLGWIGAHFGWSVEFPHPNVALYRKPPA